MPELPATAPPSPIMPIGELKSWRLLVHCSRCRRKVVLMLDALAQKHGARLPVWQAVARLRCHRRYDGEPCGGAAGRVVLAEVWVHGKSSRTVREIVVQE